MKEQEWKIRERKERKKERRRRRIQDKGSGWNRMMERKMTWRRERMWEMRTGVKKRKEVDDKERYMEINKMREREK